MPIHQNSLRWWAKLIVTYDLQWVGVSVAEVGDIAKEDTLPRVFTFVICHGLLCLGGESAYTIGELGISALLIGLAWLVKPTTLALFLGSFAITAGKVPDECSLERFWIRSLSSSLRSGGVRREIGVNGEVICYPLRRKLKIILGFSNPSNYLMCESLFAALGTGAASSTSETLKAGMMLGAEST